MANSKIYKIISKDFGHLFSFNAENEVEAEKQFSKWLNYHSYMRSCYDLEETEDTNYIENHKINL